MITPYLGHYQISTIEDYGMRKVFFGFVLVAFLLVAAIGSVGSGQSPVAASVAQQNRSGVIDCSPGYIDITTMMTPGVVMWSCGDFETATPAATATIGATATIATFTPIPTMTATATATHEPTATHTHEPTATATAAATNTPVVLSGQPCPAWVHDTYTTLGPDGNSYPTWHPMVDPATGCHFQHSHGVSNPAESSVTGELPAFGYVGAVAGMVEPHTGFKVMNFECGDVNDDGFTSRMAARLVLHMGTSGLGRYTMAHHSFQYDAMSCPGVTPAWELHLQGVAEFDEIGSICDNPRHAGRDFSTLGCVDRNNPPHAADAYEIWSSSFEVNYPGDYTGLWQSTAYISIVVAVFDPVTTVNPDDLTELIYTVDVVYPGEFNPLGANSPFRGLHLEAYNGPISIKNQGGDTSYVTDVHGNVLLNTPAGSPGTLVQYVSAVVVEGANSNASQNSQFKKDFDENNPYVIPPN